MDPHWWFGESHGVIWYMLLQANANVQITLVTNILMTLLE